MTEFKDAPASSNLLLRLEQKIFAPSYNNLPVTLITFSGAGKSAELRYLVRNINSLDRHNTDRIFCFLDLQTLLLDENKAFDEAMLFINNFFPSEIYNKLDTTVTLARFLKHITDITSDNKKITFVLENSHELFDKNHPKLAEILTTVLRIKPMNITFIFLITHEVVINPNINIKGLENLLVQNICWGKDFEFDENSANCLLQNQQKWNKIAFPAALTEKIKELAYGDPYCMKTLVGRVLIDGEIEKNIRRPKLIKDLYELFGQETLDTRYTRLANTLSHESCTFMRDWDRNPTDFLINTGLVKKTKNKYEALNPLIKNYFTNRYSKIVEQSNKLELTGQELLVFNSLQTLKPNEVCSRDRLAAIIWGSDWETKFSDWAIDQVVSRLRTKLTKQNYSKNIKVVKGKGFIFT